MDTGFNGGAHGDLLEKNKVLNTGFVVLLKPPLFCLTLVRPPVLKRVCGCRCIERGRERERKREREREPERSRDG